MRYRTPAGPLVVCIDDIEKPETDVPHRTGFVARLLSEIGRQEPEDYIRTATGLFSGTYANFDAPVICPGGAEIFAWDSTRTIWPRPFHIRRWVEGRNLAIMPRASYFRQAGEALRRFHRIRFKKCYATFRAVAKGEHLMQPSCSVSAGLSRQLSRCFLSHSERCQQTGIRSRKRAGRSFQQRFLWQYQLDRQLSGATSRSRLGEGRLSATSGQTSSRSNTGR